MKHWANMGYGNIFFTVTALSIGCGLFQNCINGLEIDGRIYKKKRGKNASFFINPIAQDSIYI